MKLSCALLAGSLATALASPAVQVVGTPTKRSVSNTQTQISLCTQYAYYSSNNYEILNNLWGQSAATSGSQCTYVDSVSDSGVAWSTQWQWQGGENNVKSYVYVGKQVAKGNLMSKIKSMQTSVNWSYDVNTMRCNVAYDIFTATDPDHVNSSGDYELMIWLGRFGGVYPISATGSPIARVSISGYAFDLWTGYNGAMRVYSFVTPGNPYTNFTADVRQFFSYLETNQGYPAATQNLIVYQIGTEAFTGGPARLTVKNFRADLSL